MQTGRCLCGSPWAFYPGVFRTVHKFYHMVRLLSVFFSSLSVFLLFCFPLFLPLIFVCNLHTGTTLRKVDPSNKCCCIDPSLGTQWITVLILLRDCSNCMRGTGEMCVVLFVYVVYRWKFGINCWQQKQRIYFRNCIQKLKSCFDSNRGIVFRCFNRVQIYPWRASCPTTADAACVTKCTARSTAWLCTG